MASARTPLTTRHSMSSQASIPNSPRVRVAAALRSPRPPPSASSSIRIRGGIPVSAHSHRLTSPQHSAPATSRRRTMKSISASERGLQREEKRTNAIDALGYNIRNQLTPRERQQALDERESIQAKRFEQMTHDCGIDKHERSAMYNAWQAILGRRPAVQRSPWRGEPFCGPGNPVSLYPLDVEETNAQNRANNMMKYANGGGQASGLEGEEDEHVDASGTPRRSPSEAASRESRRMGARGGTPARPCIVEMPSPRIQRLVEGQSREYETTRRQCQEALEQRNAWDDENRKNTSQIRFTSSVKVTNRALGASAGGQGAGGS